MAEFKDRLQDILEIKNLKPIRLSEMTGIDRGTISAYLSGKYKATQNNLYIIAKALDVSEAWLMGHDVDPQRIPDSNRNSDTTPRPTLPEFKTAQEAIKFILEVPMVADFGGYDLDRMTDEQLINFATEVAGMIQVMSRHYPSKDE